MRTYSFKQVATAAGVRTSLIKKYVRDGVRGAGCLAADESGRVSVIALEYFASLHQGQARRIAERALKNLRPEGRREDESAAESSGLETTSGAAK